MERACNRAEDYGRVVATQVTMDSVFQNLGRGIQYIAVDCMATSLAPTAF
jgi:hypothetical protein